MPTIIRPEDRKLEPLGQDTTGRNAEGDWIKHWVISEGSPYLHMTQVSPGFVIHPHSHSEGSAWYHRAQASRSACVAAGMRRQAFSADSTA